MHEDNLLFQGLKENKDYARINSVLSWFIALILTLPKTRTNISLITGRPKQLKSITFHGRYVAEASATCAE